MLLFILQIVILHCLFLLSIPFLTFLSRQSSVTKWFLFPLLLQWIYSQIALWTRFVGCTGGSCTRIRPWTRFRFVAPPPRSSTFALKAIISSHQSIAFSTGIFYPSRLSSRSELQSVPLIAIIGPPTLFSGIISLFWGHQFHSACFCRWFASLSPLGSMGGSSRWGPPRYPLFAAKRSPFVGSESVVSAAILESSGSRSCCGGRGGQARRWKVCWNGKRSCGSRI